MALMFCACSAPLAESTRVHPDEIRGVWTASPDGMQGGNWEQACAWIDSTGFNAVFPRMIYGPLAWLDTEGLIPATDGSSGDLMQECIDAAHRRGLQVHVWVVMWKLSLLSPLRADSVAGTRQTQVSYSGEPSDWLCPTDPSNRELELKALASMAANYDLDGIQLDYIRFPDGDHCFCEGCRARFARDSRLPDLNWPEDAFWGGRYSGQFREWRREQITSLVSSIAEAVERERPGIQISAAVIPDLQEARESCGQDWEGWARAGIVDFLVPMDYVSDDDSFAVLVADQVALAEVPVVPAIGPFDAQADLSLQQVMSRIDAVRRSGAAGFVIFHLERELIDLLDGIKVN